MDIARYAIEKSVITWLIMLFCLLGGWYGLLAAMLLHDDRPQIDTVTSIDLDPTCEDVARSLNRTHVADGKFEAITADICTID